MKNIDRTFWEMYSSKAFVKVKANAFSINKLQMDFVNTENKRSIIIYIEIYKAITLANDILSGRINKLVEKESQTAKSENRFPKPVWNDFGGISAKKAKERKIRSDGKAVSRSFAITSGTKVPIIFQSIQGEGREAESGAITPVYSRDDEKIIIPLYTQDLKSFALAVKSEWEAYLSGSYINGCFSSENRNKAGTGATVSNKSNASPEPASVDTNYPYPEDDYGYPPYEGY